MGRTLTALIAAGALVLAACGDDSGDEEEETEETEETADEAGEGEGEDAAAEDEEVVDSGAGEDAAAGDDASEFCAAAQTGDPEQMATVTPPEEIADAWNEVVADPENVDTGSEAVSEITDWIGANCQAPDAEGETDAPEDGAEAPGDAADSDAAESDAGGAPGEEGFMDDFCVELPEGVDSDVAC